MRTPKDWECEVYKILARVHETRKLDPVAELRPVLDKARNEALKLGDQAPDYLLAIAEHFKRLADEEDAGPQIQKLLQRFSHIFATASKGAGLLGR